MNRKQLCTVCCTVLLASSAWAQSSAESRYSTNRATFDALEELQVSAEYNEIKFGDILDDLTGQTGLIFKVNESASDNNLDMESVISLQFTETRLSTVLKFMLDEYQCTWRIEDGIIEIVSEDHSLNAVNQGLVVFDCADLLAKIRPVTVTQLLNKATSGGGFGGGGGVFNVPVKQEDVSAQPDESAEADKPATEQAPEKPAGPVVYEKTLSARHQLMSLVQETVDSDSWTNNGGVGRMVAVNKVLVVRQTWANLREIEMLLGQLRAAGLEE